MGCTVYVRGHILPSVVELNDPLKLHSKTWKQFPKHTHIMGMSSQLHNFNS